MLVTSMPRIMHPYNSTISVSFDGILVALPAAEGRLRRISHRHPIRGSSSCRSEPPRSSPPDTQLNTALRVPQPFLGAPQFAPAGVGPGLQSWSVRSSISSPLNNTKEPLHTISRPILPDRCDPVVSRSLGRNFFHIRFRLHIFGAVLRLWRIRSERKHFQHIQCRTPQHS